jgi:hypothetical protein
MKSSKTFNNKEYYEREVILAKSQLERSPDNPLIQKRLAYAMAYLGDYEGAAKVSSDPKILNIISQFQEKNA